MRTAAEAGEKADEGLFNTVTNYFSRLEKYGYVKLKTTS
jgi:hypothetical protein